MLQLITLAEYKSMPWKNGLGSSLQIDIHPAGSSLTDDKFHWRLSSARIQTDCDFSIFPNCDRWLVLVKGEGLILNDRVLSSNEPIHFSGEEPIQCRLIEGPVMDLGLVYRRDKVQAEMRRHQGLSQSSQQILTLNGSLNFFICLQGVLKVNGIQVAAYESLKVQDLKDVELESVSAQELIFFQIKLQPRTDM